MNKLVTFLSALSLVGFALPSGASAQCPNGADVCVSGGAAAPGVSVSGSASITFGRRRRAQVVVTQPPPPPAGRVVVVQPAPVAPPPQVVVTRPVPPPPPQVIVQPAPPQPEQVVIIESQAPSVRLRPLSNRKFGLTARIGGIIARDVRMGGASVGLRYRPSRIFGVELSLGAYGGEDYNGNLRTEIPLAFDFRFTFPRESRFQMVALIGGHVSWALIDAEDDFFDEFDEENFYMGGHVGLGAELQIGQHFALSGEFRAFLRQRLDAGEAPEFRDPETGRTTNTSAGGMFNLGAHFYF